MSPSIAHDIGSVPKKAAVSGLLLIDRVVVQKMELRLEVLCELLAVVAPTGVLFAADDAHAAAASLIFARLRIGSMTCCAR